MDKVVTIYDAKANLSKLVKSAQAGKTTYVGAFGVPQAVIAPLPKRPKIKIGVWQGKHKINYTDADLVQSDPEIVQQFTDSKLFPGEDAK